MSGKSPLSSRHSSRAGGRQTVDDRPLAYRHLLVIDEDFDVRNELFVALEKAGARVTTADNGRRATSLVEAGLESHAVVLAMEMTGLDGFETLSRLQALNAEVPVVMTSHSAKPQDVVRSMQKGAAHFFHKPLDPADVVRAVSEIIGAGVPPEPTRPRIRPDEDTDDWSSGPMREVAEIIEGIADTDVPVLLRGETGVGKGYVAQRIHDRSARSKGPFVKVHCAALPSQLLESELFGYAEGAFTGAWRKKAGKFEIANGGTIFLDEIAEMGPDLQAKLLQVLQDGRFTPIGSNRESHVDVRVVCATNRDLESMVERKEFRQDLLFRINVVDLEIAPLRQRREELPILLDRFLDQYSESCGKPVPPISARLSRVLQRHLFPGNIRELENMAKRIVVLQTEDCVLNEFANSSQQLAEQAMGSFQVLLDDAERNAGDVPLLEVRRRAIQAVESEIIEHVLDQTSWNRKVASRILNLSYTTLLKKIREYGIESGEEDPRLDRSA